MLLEDGTGAEVRATVGESGKKLMNADDGVEKVEPEGRDNGGEVDAGPGRGTDWD